MRAAIFVDGGYLIQQCKNAHLAPNYATLADYFMAPLRKSIPIDLLRCYFYYCPPWMSQQPTEDELRRMDVHQKFVQEIESLSRWQVKLGKLEKRWDGNKEYFEQKRVDVLLSVDFVRHAAAGHIQHAILVAGDSDFIPAVAAAKESGVTVSLWCGNSNTVHKDLFYLADEMHQIDWQTFPRIDAAKPAQVVAEAKPAGPRPPRNNPQRGNPPRNVPERAHSSNSKRGGSRNQKPSGR